MTTTNKVRPNALVTTFVAVSLTITASFFVYTLTLNAHSLINLFMLRALAAVALLLTAFLSVLILRYCKSYSSNVDNYYNLAYNDKATGMPNSNYMYDNGPKLLESNKAKYAFVAAKIKKFEVIKSVFGDESGNLLLRHMATILSSNIKEDEIATYFHSDLFCMLLKYNSVEKLEERLETLGKKISVFSLKRNTSYSISASFGVYTIDNNSLSIDSIISNGMAALKRLDDKGDCTSLYFYNDEMKKHKITEAEVFSSIEAAIDKNEIKLYILPKYSMRTGKIAGAEALARWHHPTKGIIVPVDFIPTLEKNGLIEKMDLYMLEEACKMLRSQLNEGMEPAPISFNQSRVNFYVSNYFDSIMQIVNKYNIPTRYIGFELSEYNFIEDEISLKLIVNKFHSLGFRVSVDDFCENVSSLNIFNHILVDEVKIDENFFMKSTRTELGQTLVSSIIAMINRLSIDVVAEGVEAAYQIDMLKQTDCQYVQGHYISEAVTVEAYTKMLKNNKVIIF